MSESKKSPSAKEQGRGRGLDESQPLATFALRSATSGHRLHPEEPHPYRTAFQRDRGRIVHSTAFRRLQYKTQVFVHLEADHYRNRLTHTLEGAQITRIIARQLGLNQDLAESVALAHDLGHTPFGHAGERVLAEAMLDHGGFDHNRQGLRVVDLLERRHPDYLGLNLCDETREGMLKHGSNWAHPVPIPDVSGQRSGEAQVADASDEIAYLNHDLDDALRAGILTLEMLIELPILGDLAQQAQGHHGDIPEEVRRTRMISEMIDTLVTDLIAATRDRIVAEELDSPEAIRARTGKVVGFSPRVERARREIKSFLFERFYNHPKVALRTQEAEKVVKSLFDQFLAAPDHLPEGVRARFDETGRERAIADYVAGMTDRFAISEQTRLFGAEGLGNSL